MAEAGAAALVCDLDPGACHIEAARGQADFDARFRKPADFRRRLKVRGGLRDHLRADHAKSFMLDVVEEGPDEPCLAHRRAFVFGGLEQRRAACDAFGAAIVQKVVGRQLLGVDAVDAGKHLRREGIEPGRGFRCRKAEIDRRRMVGRKRDQQCRLAFFQDELVRQAADALGDPIIEKRYLFHRRISRLAAGGKRVERFKPRRGFRRLPRAPCPPRARPRICRLATPSSSPPSK